MAIGSKAIGNLIFLISQRGRYWLLSTAIAATHIHDDTGAFPGFHEAVAGGGGVELEDEVVHVVHEIEEGGGVGFDFFEEGAAVHDLAAWGVHHLGVGGDGGAEGGDAGGGDAAFGGVWLADGSLGDVADGGGLGDEFLGAEFDDLALRVVHLAVAVEVAGLLEMVRQSAGEGVGEVFERGLRDGFFIRRTARGSLRLRGFQADGGVVRRELGDVGGEVRRLLAFPDGFVFGALSDSDARADHIQMILES